MTTDLLFQELERITLENIALTKKYASKLSSEQRKWKRSEDMWNVNEIYAHLNEYAKYYHNAFNKKIDTTRFTEPKDIFLSSPLGRSAWKSMKLGNAKNIKRKFKAQKLYNPTIVTSIVSEDPIQDFINHQEELLAILERSKTINLRKSKVAISIAKVVRLRMGDALLFVVYHNERHVQQVLNLLKLRNFPAK